MARAIWKGVISFGLVSIPVEVHTAVRDHRPHFRLLHAKDTSPIKFSRVCEHEGKPVAWDELVKGYEYTKGEYVVLTKADFEAAAVEKTKRVDILDFVDAEEIDDRYFETPYYLAPGKGGEHAYALLREAMRDNRRVGIAKFVLRDTMHLCAVEVIDDALVLTLMRFADELVDTASLNLPAKKEVRKQELDMAKALMDTLAAEWKPEKYTDDYRDNLMRIIKAKAKGKTVRLSAGEAAAPPTKVVDLMERLRQSLDAAKGGGRKTAARAERPRAVARHTAARKTRKTKRVA
jgi:DNA end-binding protein Ku